MPPRPQRAKRAKASDSEDIQPTTDGIFPFLDLDAGLVESITRELSKTKTKAKAPAADLDPDLQAHEKESSRAKRRFMLLLSASPSVARLALASCAEWRVDLKGLSYVAWCLGVKARDEAPSKAKQVNTRAEKTGIPPGRLLLQRNLHGRSSDLSADSTYQILSDMASRGLIRALELHGCWLTEGDSFPSIEPWTRFLTDIAPLLTHLDLSGISDACGEGPSDAHLAPLASSASSFPQLQSIKLWYRFAVEVDSGRYSFETLMSLAALPLLREIPLVLDRKGEFSLYLVVRSVKEILSDPRGMASPPLARAALELAREAATELNQTGRRLDELLTALDDTRELACVGQLFRRILSLLLQPPTGPQWTPYASFMLTSLAIDTLDLWATAYVDTLEYPVADVDGTLVLPAVNGKLPFVFGVDLEASGQLVELLSLALPAETDTAVAARLLGSFVDTGKPWESPLELAHRVPRKAARLLRSLYIANKALPGNGAANRSGSWGSVLVTFCDALQDFERPDNQICAAHFFAELEGELLKDELRPAGRLLAALSQRVREPMELNDLRGWMASESVGSSVKIPFRVPEVTNVAARCLRMLQGIDPISKQPGQQRSWGAKFTHAEVAVDAFVLMRLMSIPDLDLSSSGYSLMPQLCLLRSRAYDEPSADADKLAIDILRAFGLHSDLLFSEYSIFSPSASLESEGISPAALTLLYTFPVLAVSFLARPGLHSDEGLWAVVRSIEQCKWIEGLCDSLTEIYLQKDTREALPERFNRLLRTSSDAQVPLNIRYAALTVSARLVSSATSGRSDSCDIWNPSISKLQIARLYEGWDYNYTYQSDDGSSDDEGESFSFQTVFFGPLFQFLPSLLTIWSTSDALSDTERAELGSGLDALGFLGCAAVAATPSGQRIPTGPFTAKELVARLLNWAGSEGDLEPKDSVAESGPVRVSSAEYRKIVTRLALGRLVHDDACGEVLFTAPYELLGRFLLTLANRDKSHGYSLSQPVLTALVGAARSDPLGIFMLLKDTPFCSDARWTDRTTASTDNIPVPPLFDVSSPDFCTPATLEMIALFLRHWLASPPADGSLPPQVTALGRSSALDLAGIAFGLHEYSLDEGGCGSRLLSPMAALILRTLLSNFRQKEQADLISTVYSAYIAKQEESGKRFYTWAYSGASLDAGPTMSTVASALQRVIDEGPSRSDLEAHLALTVGPMWYWGD